MKNIVYFEPADAEKFEVSRFEKSLRNYANVPSEAVAEALKSVEEYETLHVSRLIKIGVDLIAEFGDEVAAEGLEFQKIKLQYRVQAKFVLE